MNETCVNESDKKSRLGPYERVALLLDGDSFRETADDGENGMSPGADGVITGSGTVGGKPVFVFAEDFSVSGGAIGLSHGRKIARVIREAVRAKCPVIGIYDSVGARIEEGVNALAGCGEMIAENVRASGVIPQIAVITGPCAGAAAYDSAICDFVFAVSPSGQLFVTGSKVIESATGEKCDPRRLGGAEMHAAVSGTVHFLHRDEKECFREVRRLITLLPASREDKRCFASEGFRQAAEEVDSLVPKNGKIPYSMGRLIEKVFDADSFLEVGRLFAGNLLVGFAKLSGMTVGIVANNPGVKAGCLDIPASDKAARFVRFCDSFSIPILTFVDTPGYLSGVEEERNGIIRHGAKVLYAYSEATTVKVTVIIRKAYGGAYIAMGSRHMGADHVYTTPLGEIAVMGAESAVHLLYRKEAEGSDSRALLRERVAAYRKKYINYHDAVANGYVDGVLELRDIRERLFRDVQALREKREAAAANHGNMPL